MSNHNNYCQISNTELRNPRCFLPTSLSFTRDDNIKWTYCAYASWNGTSTPLEAIKIERHGLPRDNTATILPPRMAKYESKIREDEKGKEYIKTYISKYKQANADIQQWYAVQTPNEYTETAIENWKLTCDNLLDDRDFNTQKDWPLPAFLPWYIYTVHDAYQSYFDTATRIFPERNEYWEKRKKEAHKMLYTWEETTFKVFLPKQTPFPKCLWYHKLKICHDRNQPQTWSNYFKDSPFEIWGKTDNETEKKSTNANAKKTK